MSLASYTQAELLTDVQLAEVRNLNLHTLRADRRQKRLIPFIRIGRSVRYQLKVVDEALARYAVGGPESIKRGREARR